MDTSLGLIPFSADAYFAAAEAINLALWPLHIPFLSAALLAIWLTLFPTKLPASLPLGYREEFQDQWAPRLAAGVLFIFWLTSGIEYLGFYYAELNWAGTIFALFFLVQAFMMGWSGILRGNLVPRDTTQDGRLQRLPLLTIAYGVVILPLIAYLEGAWMEALPSVGMTSGPTVIFTLGLMMLCRTPWPLLVIPCLWCAIETFQALGLSLFANLPAFLFAIMAVVMRLKSQ